MFAKLSVIKKTAIDLGSLPFHFYRMSSSSVMSKFDPPSRFKGNEKSVWVEYIQLALKYKPLNLGQGFPDFHAPANVTKALASTATSENPLLNQYTRGFGHPRLVNAIGKLYSKILNRDIAYSANANWKILLEDKEIKNDYGHPRLVNAIGKLYSKILNRDIDPNNEIIVTSGAYEALYATLQGHTSPGDEWIIIEPYFDCYVPMVRCAGGIPRCIPLKPTKTTGTISSADWVFDKKEMESLFNDKTKGIIINTPHNPIGKVFTREELTFIADLAKKWNVLVVSDEVYEWMVYEPCEHIRIATLPDMYERTITIGSAGKTFSVTGWKIGWAYGPSNLLYNLKIVHQNCVYTCSTPIQEAVAIGFEEEFAKLGQPDCYFHSLARELLPKRDYMAKFLTELGMSPTVPEGGYFMVANWKALEKNVRLDEETDANKDYRFTKWMTKNVGVQGIPPSAFYSEEHKHLGEDNVRYCFIKKDENLKEAAEILLKWKSNQA